MEKKQTDKKTLNGHKTTLSQTLKQKQSSAQPLEHKKQKIVHAYNHRPLSFLRRSLDKDDQGLSQL